MRYLIQLAYKGTSFHGWQKQENAHTVQSEIEQKLSLILGENTEILGCGRTDTGVHARDYYAHFDSEKTIVCDKLTYKLNQLLTTEIAIYKIFPVPDTFNARFDAISRTYKYHLSLVKDPFNKEYSWYQYGPFNMNLMNEAAAILLKHKDFECFSKVHTQVNNFKCDITFAEWTQHENQLVFTITANRFLRNMVRAIVGTLLEVGRDRMSLHEFEEVLKSKNRSEAGQSVPAQGLFLQEIKYPTTSFIFNQ